MGEGGGGWGRVGEGGRRGPAGPDDWTVHLAAPSCPFCMLLARLTLPREPAARSRTRPPARTRAAATGHFFALVLQPQPQRTPPPPLAHIHSSGIIPAPPPSAPVNPRQPPLAPAPRLPLRYVHRVGRSARMGAAGEAVLLLMPHEVPYAALLRSRGVLLEQLDASSLAKWLPAPPEDALEGSQPRSKKSKSGGAAGGSGSGGAAAAASEGAARQFAGLLQRRLAVAVSQDAAAGKLAKDAFRSYLRAYATHSGDIKRVFHVRSLHLGHMAHSFCLQVRAGGRGRGPGRGGAGGRDLVQGWSGGCPCAAA